MINIIQIEEHKDLKIFFFVAHSFHNLVEFLDAMFNINFLTEM